MAWVIRVLVRVLAGCTVNPYTQRSQLVMLPPSFESKIVTLAYQQILTDPGNPVSYNPTATVPVQRVAARLIAAAQQSKYSDIARSFEWKVAVIEDPHLRNAVAYPGGKLLIYTGLFPVAKNEAELAAVLAHEIVHVLARHSAEQMTHDALRITREREALLLASMKRKRITSAFCSRQKPDTMLWK